MFALPISKPYVLKALFFYQNNPKIKLFLQKNAKFSSAGGKAPIPPLASGGWGLRAQNPNTAPPPLQISGYAPFCHRNGWGQGHKRKFSKKSLQNIFSGVLQ